MIKLIKDLIFGWRYKKAVRKAIKVQHITGCKQFVIMYKGRPGVVSKQKIRSLVATRYFTKGVKVQDIERRALFVTH